MEQPPVAFLYRWTVAAGFEDDFRARWHATTFRLREEAGSWGSCLTRDSNGDFVAFARWPSEAARDAAFADMGPADPWPGILGFEETRLAIEDDLLIARV